MTEIEWLFIRTASDLESRISSGTRYDLIAAAVLLRKLLFDSRPLIHQVNRAYRLKLRFEVKQWPKSDPQKGKLELRTVQPDEGDQTILLTLDRFLSTNCLYYHEKTFSVKDILHHVAYIRGGIHTPRAPDTQKDVALADEIMQMLKFEFDAGAAVEIGIGLVKPISHVTLKAIEPLVNRITDGA